mgnify:CR=1 FL=1
MADIKGLLFDLDGVIVDTAKYHFVAWKALADQLKVPFSHEENEQLKGVGREDSLNRILAWGNIDIANHEKDILLKKKNEHYKSLISLIWGLCFCILCGGLSCGVPHFPLLTSLFCP